MKHCTLKVATPAFARRALLALPALITTLFLPLAASACSSCGCTLNSDWAAQGYSADRGLRFDIRYDYFNQNQLRTGSGKADRAALVTPNDDEIQQSTINRNLMLGVDYPLSREWGIGVQLPVYDRPHTTIAPGDDELSQSRSRGVGDIRVVGRYQGLNDDRAERVNRGVQFGLKLPTGNFHTNFNAGPQNGTALDRGLQAGTGTTDILLGIYQFGLVSDKLGYFANLLAQLPLNSRDGFRPGAGFNVNVGLRYENDNVITPQLQINARTERRESGINADVRSSGATLVNLSPGFTAQLSPTTQSFMFVQVPIYQRVNGLQIEPRYSVSVGLRWSL